MDSFVNLDVRSAYSFLWGAFTPDELVRSIKALGQSAVALTDDGLFGMIPFCRAARDASLQPIVGAGIGLADGSRLVLLVRDRQGYRNLCRILSQAFSHGLWPPGPAPLEDLAARSRGLICLAGLRDSCFRELLKQERTDEAGAWLTGVRAAFPHDDGLFVALSGRPEPEDRMADRQAVELARKSGLPYVRVNSVSFLKPEDYHVHRTLVEIQRRHHHRDILPLPDGSFCPASGSEPTEPGEFPEAVAETARIARLCLGFPTDFGEVHPPEFSIGGRPSEDLAAICRDELDRKFPTVPRAYGRRLSKELAMIDRRDLAGFFLLVREVSEFARRLGIRHSVRGSAAGSLVVHLTVGGVDPVAHDLLFERFINDGRADLPDVDIDFDSERRDEVIGYLLEKLSGRAALVSTVHTLRPRSAVRLIARAMGVPPAEIGRLTRCLPWSLGGLDLAGALDTLPELKESPLRAEPAIVETAVRLSRLPFQPSVHLGGILITPGRLTDWTPTCRSNKGFPVAHLDKDGVEWMGLLKLDVLGLRMHTAVRKASEILAARGKAFDPDALPLSDPAVYDLLCSSETVGVFQVESPGQRQLLGRLQPRSFSEIVAEISLFRPGPVEGNLVDPFVRRKNGDEPAEYPHPLLEPILAETHGLILFQEQVLRIVHDFAGLSYGEADAFRRTMTKDRGPERMAALGKRFVEAAVAAGRDRAMAEDVFDRIMALAAYGFCKAHAASFAYVTYQSAYLKAHHPQAFYLGLLNAGQVGSYSASVILNEARRRGLPVHGPHVNAGGLEYEPCGRGIRAPLIVVRGVGPGLAARVGRERKRGGAFSDRDDFQIRANPPADALRLLTLAGALDGLDTPMLLQGVAGA